MHAGASERRAATEMSSSQLEPAIINPQSHTAAECRSDAEPGTGRLNPLVWLARQPDWAADFGEWWEWWERWEWDGRGFALARMKDSF
jgi:hypothetical protein